MKKLFLFVMLAVTAITLSAQEPASSKREQKEDRKEVRRQKINNLIRQSEEGILIYRKQSIFGIQSRTNGYGGFYELGKMKTNRITNTYRIDITEIKNQREERIQNPNQLGKSVIYGKINYFYPVTLGFGQQRILGQKGNKNGVAVSLVYNGGVSLGLLRPYYIDVIDGTQQERTIKYSKADSVLFMNGIGSYIGSSGIGKGWNEIKVKPGVFAKTAMRFDYGRFNEVVSGLEIGLSAEYYMSDIEILLTHKKKLFFQGYIALLFGRRK